MGSKTSNYTLADVKFGVPNPKNEVRNVKNGVLNPIHGAQNPNDAPNNVKLGVSYAKFDVQKRFYVQMSIARVIFRSITI